jgi:type IV secretory pathway TrbF-like protein
MGTYSINSISPSWDGGYIMAGWMRWNLLVMKIDSGGIPEWQKTYGQRAENARWVQSTSDRRYIIAGSTVSYGAGESDMWILKIPELGDISATCPPDMIEDPGHLVEDSAVSSYDTHIVPIDTDATIVNTNVIPAVTFAVIETQCSG